MNRRRVAAVLGLLTAALCIGGCASGGYVGNRLNDAADIATITLGTGAGAKARVGPIQLALIKNSDLVGLRAGQVFCNGNDLLANDELYVLPFPLPATRTDHWYVLPYGIESFSHESDSLSHMRGKDVAAQSPFPGIAIGRGSAFYSQVEVAGGLGLTIRLGLNPGELLDFLLGFVFLDIYQDDVSNWSY